MKLGATWDGAGVNFALFSQHAERVELCLFEGSRELDRIALERGKSGDPHVWHAHLREARPGQAYGYRVHGPRDPERGHRFDPDKVLLDPYARLIAGDRGQVVDPAFTWGDDRPLRTPWEDTVVYELHVKGFTRRHPGVPENLRGTYAGLCYVIDHLKNLGVTAVELLPVHAMVDEPRLVHHGLRNYWGYNSIGFFAPEMRYSASGTLGEFKSMVKALHAAGLEVILDVVYNHTGEGDHTGPTLSFRGIDNAVYYRLEPQDRRRYVNYTGTGNTFNLGHPAVLALVIDSLRYWVEEMHVDGFRFDLAAVLTRDSAFLDAVRQDPVLAQVKLIAEPWDLGPGGYRLGSFPPGWAEWNDKYRDTVRAFWRGDEGRLGELAARISGSRDLFRGSRTVNYVTAHDGFTLEDVVSYEKKRNRANHEDNRDGSDHNRSWNCGEESYSTRAGVRALRRRQKRNLLATLLLSRGVPMLLAGDELGRTQHGNNNAYCQDNDLSWVDWMGKDEALLEFVKKLISLRKAHPPPEQPRWLRPQGGEMAEEDWRMPFARCVGAQADGLLLLLNAHHEAIDFALPGEGWTAELDTADQQAGFAATYPLQGRSLAMLTRP